MKSRVPLTPAQRIMRDAKRAANKAKKAARVPLTPAQKAARKAESTKLPNAVTDQCAAMKLPAPVREYVLSGPRKFAYDLAWPDLMLLAECQGGIWGKSTNSSHAHPASIQRDADKLNYAVIRGWRVLHLTTSAIESGEAIGVIRQAIRGIDED